MKRIKLCFWVCIHIGVAVWTPTCLLAQQKPATETANEKAVQFSGVVLTEENRQLLPVPYADIYIKGKKRGTFSDLKGYYSFVAEKGDMVVFSSVGFRKVEIKIPDTLRDNRYTFIQLMTKDTFNLPETVIYPWPSREHFKIDFLAMNVHERMNELAMRNLASKTLKKMRREVPYDGNENGDYLMRQQSQSYYSMGQYKPMNIFSPIAWKDFFDAWKAGKFKRKKGEDKDDE